MTYYWRCCAECSESIVTNNARTSDVFCKRCAARRPSFDEWAAKLGPGDRVYVQPYVAWRGLSRSQYLVIERDGNRFVLQLIGIPESRITTDVGQLGQRDLTPRARSGAAP
jgi:hypothetical protein